MNTQRVEGHTPTPWIGTMESPDFSPLIGADGTDIFTYTIDDNGLHFKLEDVDFIVHACNNIERLEKVNEALVRALEPFALMADGYDAEFGKTDTTSLATAIGSIHPRLLRDARAALAKEPA